MSKFSNFINELISWVTPSALFVRVTDVLRGDHSRCDRHQIVCYQSDVYSRMGRA
jgi:hypothetical protein